jgi:superfamily II DNA or RNA helicase
MGERTLWLVHRGNLVEQTHREFESHWPDVQTGRYHAGVRETEAYNLVGTIQSVADHLDEFASDAFGYLVVDEAHHAAADTYRRVLGHFRPRFILGLTATVERADGQDLLEVFRDCAHRLTLREAVERGELVPIRCVRVATNVDLGKVRYNQVQYNRQDIEETIAIPARDQLIVDTYLQHVPGRKAVAFAVNVRHGEDLADRFRSAGVAARSVSGRMSNREREQHLAAFREGQLRVLCACDILNEGWDCPDVEVLLMARPTLSKVIYLQQLGRGTRRAPGKECLIVFDFVDNADRYKQSYTLNSVLGLKRYRPGGLLVAPQHLHDAENEALERGDQPTTVLEIGLWVRDYQEIDVFDWRQEVGNMINVPDLEHKLGVPEGRVRNAVERREVKPDHELQLGERTYVYFKRDRIDEIRVAVGAPNLDDHTARDRFLQFVADMDMTLSYKPVMLLALLDAIDDEGRAKLGDVVQRFRGFYQERRQRSLPVDRPGARKQSVDELSDSDARRLMLDKPFATFERPRFLRYDRDLAYVRFVPHLWRQLGPADIEQVRQTCRRKITAYYERFETRCGDDDAPATAADGVGRHE